MFTAYQTQPREGIQNGFRLGNALTYYPLLFAPVIRPLKMCLYRGLQYSIVAVAFSEAEGEVDGGRRSARQTLLFHINIT